jgi:hypothetical protein
VQNVEQPSGKQHELGFLLRPTRPCLRSP